MGVVIRSRVNITFPWKLEIGDHVWIGDEVLILSLERVLIGGMELGAQTGKLSFFLGMAVGYRRALIPLAIHFPLIGIPTRVS